MIYIGTNRGLYRWYSGLPWPVFHALQDRVIVDLRAGPGGLMAALDGTGRVVVSHDRGLTWEEMAGPGGTGRPTHVRFDPSSGNLVLATAGPLRLYERSLRSEPTPRRPPTAMRRAQEWIARLRRIGESELATAVLDPETETQRRGWSRLGAPPVDRVGDLAGLTLLEPGREPGIWFAGVLGAGIVLGSERGSRWDKVEGLPDQVFCLIDTGDCLLAGTDDGVWTSRDGRGWTPQSNLQGRTITALAARPGDPKHLWAGIGPSGDGPGLYESKDAGQTWTRVARGFPSHLGEARIVAIRYDEADPDTALVALSTGELYRTKTDGLWWEPISRQAQELRVIA
jgi:hypothetical protein